MKRQLKTTLITIELIMAITLVASLRNPLGVQARKTPMMTIEPNLYQAHQLGEVFNVSVNLYNLETADKAVAVQFRVTYNASVLEALDVTEGPFLQQFNNTANPPFTFMINYIEDDPIYGTNVLVGIILIPNGTGYWTNFPYGNGTLATITFKAIRQTAEPQPPASSMLVLTNTLLLSDTSEIPHTLVNGYYEIEPLSFSYEPSIPRAGQPVLFKALGANHSVTYSWNFGDGTSSNVTESSLGHIYATPGDYTVTLTCISDSLISSSITKTITILPNNTPTIEVTVDVGKTHFKGEIAEFSVLTANYGEAVNATKIEASLYYDGTLLADLTSSVQPVDTGFYRIPYSIPADAKTGKYTLKIKAEYYNAKGIGMNSFEISPTLTNWDQSIAQITGIKDGIATVSNGITNIKLNLTAINATVTGLITSGKDEILAKIDTSLGTLTTRLDAINATITEVKGNTVTISTTLGEVKTTLSDTQSTATTTLYAASILSAIAVILAAAILIFVRKK